MKKEIVGGVFILLVLIFGVFSVSALTFKFADWWGNNDQKITGKSIIQVNPSNMCVKCAGKYAYVGGKTGIQCSKESTKMYGSYAMPGKDCGVKKDYASPVKEKPKKKQPIGIDPGHNERCYYNPCTPKLVDGRWMSCNAEPISVPCSDIKCNQGPCN